jgi:hypothetical protein
VSSARSGRLLRPPSEQLWSDFDASAPGADLLRKFGFVPDKVLQAAKNRIAKQIADPTRELPTFRLQE